MSEMRALDGNEAVARVAYAVSEICSIYPITPSSPMAENADVWSADGKPNIWGKVPDIVEMQSEGCLLYTSPSPRDGLLPRMPSSA